MNQPKFFRLLSACVSFGKRCLIENIGESLDRCLYPFFNKDLLIKDGIMCKVVIDSEAFTLDDNFRLYLTSEISQPQFPPEISVFANFINFGVTEEGLEE
mmetsp:Transcript_12587/g.19602  ORF Transcript_12587/g.19602 Transcript_12587/m.19602 type:complete len:100 (+) Transcript_12587:2026-2325(+)